MYSAHYFLSFTTFATAINWSNPWLVGIGTTILGGVIGLLVNIITRFLWSRKDNSEYQQNVKNANQEIIHTLRIAIAESSIPPRDLVEALVRATARNYGVKSVDLMSLVEFSDSLIKDVMDSNFISFQQKLIYSKAIMEFGKGPKQSTVRVNAPSDAHPTYFNTYERKLRNRSINYISILAAAMALVAGFSIIRDDNSLGIFDFGGVNDFVNVYIPLVAITLLAPVLAYAFPSKFKFFLKRKKKNDEDEEKND